VGLNPAGDGILEGTLEGGAVVQVVSSVEAELASLELDGVELLRMGSWQGESSWSEHPDEVVVEAGDERVELAESVDSVTNLSVVLSGEARPSIIKDGFKEEDNHIIERKKRVHRPERESWKTEAKQDQEVANPSRNLKQYDHIENRRYIRMI